MTNKSMIRADENAKKGVAAEVSGKSSQGKPSQSLPDESNAHSPQLKPVIDEKRTGLQKRDGT